MTLKMTFAAMVLVMLVAVAAPAEDKKSEGTIEGKPIGLDLLTADSESVDASKVEVEPSIIRARDPEAPRSLAKRNALLIGALWTATALDIHSSKRLDQTRFHEVNKFGSTGGQIATSALATGAAIIIERYASRRMRWLSSVLLNGAAASHAVGAVHNYLQK